MPPPHPQYSPHDSQYAYYSQHSPQPAAVAAAHHGGSPQRGSDYYYPSPPRYQSRPPDVAAPLSPQSPLAPHSPFDITAYSKDGTGYYHPIQAYSAPPPTSPPMGTPPPPPPVKPEQAAPPKDGRSLILANLDLSDRVKSIKTTVAKTVIAVNLARTWTDTIVLVRPIAFGQPIEIEHVLGCHEALIVLTIVFASASYMLFALSTSDHWSKGLITTSCFMWSGATFGPTATTCMALFPMHPLGATLGYTCVAAAISIIFTRINGWFKSIGIPVAAQAASLVGTFIVISAAAVCNKEATLLLSRQHKDYLATYFEQQGLAQQGGQDVVELLSTSAVEGAGGVSVGVTPTFNPAALALLWALVTNGTLLRVVVLLSSLPSTDQTGGAIILFLIKFFAMFSAFQWMNGVKLTWEVIAAGQAADWVVLALRAVTVFGFAACYITWGTPISGVPGLAKDRILERWEVDKAFHDTAVGMSIGQTFTPFFHKTFEIVCLAGGSLEAALYPPRDASHAEDMAYKQDFEVAAAIIYCLFFATPLSAWLYYAVVLQPDEAKSEKQNAAAAADDGGGDDGGDDGGGD